MRIAWGLLLVAGCSGAPFTIGVDAVPIEGSAPAEVEGGLRELKRDAGSGAEASVDARVDAGEMEAAADARDAAPEATGGKDAAPEATDAQDAAPEGGDGKDAAPDARIDAEPFCAPIQPTVFGCGISIYTYPAQYCAFPMSDVTVGLSTPPECQCAGHYTCECVTATNPCAPTGQKFVSCQVGTTYGVVVVCK